MVKLLTNSANVILMSVNFDLETFEHETSDANASFPSSSLKSVHGNHGCIQGVIGAILERQGKTSHFARNKKTSQHRFILSVFLIKGNPTVGDAGARE